MSLDIPSIFRLKYIMNKFISNFIKIFSGRLLHNNIILLINSKNEFFIESSTFFSSSLSSIRIILSLLLFLGVSLLIYFLLLISSYPSIFCFNLFLSIFSIIKGHIILLFGFKLFSK